MAPFPPQWARPSHADIQEVAFNDGEFASKSFSKISLPPFGFFAKMAFPPCTITDGATYATVQVGPDKHLSLNSDLMYINHSCDPSLVSQLFCLMDPPNMDAEQNPLRPDFRHGQSEHSRRPQGPSRGRRTNRLYPALRATSLSQPAYLPTPLVF